MNLQLTEHPKHYTSGNHKGPLNEAQKVSYMAKGHMPYAGPRIRPKQQAKILVSTNIIIIPEYLSITTTLGQGDALVGILLYNDSISKGLAFNLEFLQKNIILPPKLQIFLKKIVITIFFCINDIAGSSANEGPKIPQMPSAGARRKGL